MSKSELAGRLQQETVAAMKARDKERLTVLRMLQAAFKQVEVDTRRDVDEADAIKIVRSYAKKVKDQLAGAESAGRPELVAQARAELLVVNEFLPVELDDAALAEIVRAVIAETGATTQREMGQVMKAAMARVAGQADGGRVGAAVKAQLGG
jgi:uncharacterized protein